MGIKAPDVRNPEQTTSMTPIYIGSRKALKGLRMPACSEIRTRSVGGRLVGGASAESMIRVLVNECGSDMQSVQCARP